MRFFGIKYTLKNQQQLDVGVVADNREQAVHALMDKQKGVDSVIGINVGYEVHLISKNVLQNLSNQSEDLKPLKDQIVYLKECLMDSDERIVKLTNEGPEPVANDGEIGLLHEKIVEMEIQLMKKGPVDNSALDKLNEKVVYLETENKKLLDTAIPSEVPTEYVCLECRKKYKTFTGLEKHFNKEHKGK